MLSGYSKGMQEKEVPSATNDSWCIHLPKLQTDLGTRSSSMHTCFRYWTFASLVGSCPISFWSGLFVDTWAHRCLVMRDCLCTFLMDSLRMILDPNQLMYRDFQLHPIWTWSLSNGCMSSSWRCLLDQIGYFAYKPRTDWTTESTVTPEGWSLLIGGRCRCWQWGSTLCCRLLHQTSN